MHKRFFTTTTWFGNCRTRTVLCFVLFAFLVAGPVAARPLPNHKYPRTAAFFLKTSPWSEQEIQTLARFQLLILDMQTQVTNERALRRLRDLNPHIILLAYISPIDVPFYRLSEIEHPGGMWHQLLDGVSEEWFLKTDDGQHVGFWPGNVSMNLLATNGRGQTYADYVARFIGEKILATGLWDGIFFETVWDGISWLNQQIDLNRDGVRESRETVDRAWRDGHNLLFRLLRERYDSEYFLVGNGVLEPYAVSLNGRMFEGFPDPSEGGWVGSVKRYRAVEDLGVNPHLRIINSDTANTGNWRNWEKMRYGLATTLLLDGYYSFDYGTQKRDELYAYDEYGISLGKPSSIAMRNVLTGNGQEVVPGVWRRDYQHGVVFVNSTHGTRELRLEEEFERLRGSQDPATNDGRITSRVTLQPESGMLLLRPIEAIVGSPYVNGAFARIFDKSGQSTRNGFFAYEGQERGSTVLVRRDLDRDGKEEIVVGEINRLEIRRDGQVLTRLFPYGEAYRGGIRFAVGDLDRDGKDEIVTVPASDAPAHVRLFRMNGSVVREGWIDGDGKGRGGATVALGDLDGDGTLEIIVGSGKGEKPRVRIYRTNGSRMNSGEGFRVYGDNFRGGVNVASGDVDGDGKAEIIVGARRGGGPHVRVFSGQGAIVHSGFFAFDSKKREGVDVLAHDFDGDGKAEIVALSTNVFTTAQLFRR